MKIKVELNEDQYYFAIRELYGEFDRELEYQKENDSNTDRLKALLCIIKSLEAAYVKARPQGKRVAEELISIRENSIKKLEGECHA